MAGADIGDPHTGGRDFSDDPVIIDLREVATVVIQTTGNWDQLNATAYVSFHLIPVHSADTSDSLTSALTGARRFCARPC